MFTKMQKFLDDLDSSHQASRPRSGGSEMEGLEDESFEVTSSSERLAGAPGQRGAPQTDADPQRRPSFQG
jgi:hypothetical protein